ncbi:hypothetical protein [Chryseobacterium sp. 18068]|uniref:hypothetical protein n=1 Tax=Chryseobacterium sp. 18068 TaxID=2681414 RepID=UPI0013573499|nr:hypothetical protein [Chryseobacterium sp. 18068]
MMKYIFLFLIAFLFFSCKKNNRNDNQKINISDITNEKNYKMTSKKENDTVVQISGENNQYILHGSKDVKNNKKIGWWKIEDKTNKFLYEIEFISANPNKENQIKFYNKGKLITRFSQYCDIVYKNNGYEFKFYFPKYNNEKTRVEFDYMTENNNIIEDKSIDCKIEKDYYICFIPRDKKDHSIAGVATFFSESENKGEATFSSVSMFVSN